MWVLDPVNSPALLGQVRPHAIAEFDVVWCGEGWKSLVASCHRALAADFPDYRFYAIKQKFGVLSFQARARAGSWTHEEFDAVQRITDEYAQRSATICEWCGATGRLRDRRAAWQTLCDSCDEQFDDRARTSIHSHKG